MRSQTFRRLVAAVLLLIPAIALSSSAVSQSSSPYAAPRHTSDFPGLASGDTQSEERASIALGPQLERNRSARWLLDDQRKLDRALAALQPQRPGQVDAYVVVVGFDSDPIFGREAREAARVLSRRYGAAGRIIVLAGTDGSGPSDLPNGSPNSLAIALARIAELMDRSQDVVIVYTAGHGSKLGLAYHDGDDGFGILPPARMAKLFGELGIRNRMLILSACYSGIFVPAMRSDTTALFTAARADRTSFGCAADRDWTFYGDAMINHALRQPVPLAEAAANAGKLIAQWEAAGKITPSVPQVSIGKRVDEWLKPLEAQMPQTATAMVGRPAISILDEER